MSVKTRRFGRQLRFLWIAPAFLVPLSVALGLLVNEPQAALAETSVATTVWAGDNHTCAIEKGKAYCWGSNDHGELGDGGTTDSGVPVAVDTSGVLAGKTVTQIAAGEDYTCVLDSAGAAYCWGWNGKGQLGDGSTTDSGVPVAVDTSGVLAGKTVTQIAAGEDYTCVLDSAGAAYCWGGNDFGGLGDGSTNGSSIPVAVDTGGVLTGKALTHIAAGDFTTCVLDSTGAAYCWGWNGYGELGNGSTAYYLSDPVAVDTSGVLAGKTLTQVTGGGAQICALGSTGAAYCWGANYYGELGDGSTADSSVPVAVDTSGLLAGKILIQVTAGELGAQTCAVDDTGTAYCWGDNQYGQLGDGTTSNSSVPVAVDATGVLAGKTVTKITVGGSHTCAADAAGAMYCWGGNAYGDLGDDTGASSSVPVLAGPQAPAGVTAVPADTAAAVSWTAPADLDGGTLTGYTATATPGGETCTTTGATMCTISSLSNGTTYSVTVVAHTTVGDSGASKPVNVTPGTGVAFTSDPSDIVTFGAAFSSTVTTSGWPPPKITKAGQLPPGVTFTPHKNGTATLSGTPRSDASGVYPLTFTAKDRSGTATQAFTLTVNRPPGLKKTRTIRAKVGIPLHHAITAAGYPAPALTESGSLPTGLTFADNGNGTATIAGTPATGSRGRYSITVTATNNLGTTSRTYRLEIRERRHLN